MKQSLPSEYFDDVYRAKADPWSFTSSPYEAEKYAKTLESLPQPRFQRAFEIGCSIGVLTAMLAPRCGELLAVDVSEAALEQAKQRCAHLPNVSLELMSIPREFPDGSFDLILLSEIGYYWNSTDLALAQQRIAEHLSDGGFLLLVHWTPIVDDYPSDGNAVHDSFLNHAAFRHVKGHRAETYRLDVLARQ